jgi:hypothetical protein
MWQVLSEKEQPVLTPVDVPNPVAGEEEIGGNDLPLTETGKSNFNIFIFSPKFFK